MPLDPATGQCPIGLEEPTCTVCHITSLGQNIITFFLAPSSINGGVPLVPTIATALLAVGGFIFFSAAGNPARLQKGKQILLATLIGLLIIYGSWVGINTGLTFLGVTVWSGPGDWWGIPCGL